MYKIIIVSFLFVVLCGCAARYPMGLTHEQWVALSPERQAEYRARQYEMDARLRQVQAAARAEREWQQQTIIEADKQRLADLYANARYGDIVRVSIEGGHLEYYNRRHAYHPVAFDIARGEVKDIPVTQSGQIQQTVTFRVRLSPDGNTLFFNDNSQRPDVLVQRDWEMGQTYATSSEGIAGGFSLPGATIFVKYKDLPGGPERIIIERR